MFNVINIAVALIIVSIIIIFIKAFRQTRNHINEQLKGIDPSNRDEIFKKLSQNFSFSGDNSNFDPSRLEDPLAGQTEWTPVKSGGASFRTHNAVKVDTNRMEFRASIAARVFYMIFFFMGIGIAVGFSVNNISMGTFALNMDTLFPVLFGLIFMTIGGCLFYFGTKPVVFDKRKGFYWKGRKKPDKSYDMESEKDFTRLEDIHALQVIAEYCRGENRSYRSYELNLVLNNGSRVNVVDHGDSSKLREDARTLSRFLEKPVWDATL